MLSLSSNINVFENLFNWKPKRVHAKKTYDSITVCILVECNVIAVYSVYQVVSIYYFLDSVFVMFLTSRLYYVVKLFS